MSDEPTRGSAEPTEGSPISDDTRAPKSDAPAAETVTLLRRGDSGPAVDDVRERLTRLGFLTTTEPHSDYDAALEQAVCAFQQSRGVPADGIVGPQTFRHLEEARWKLGDRVLIYTPGHLIAGDDVMDLQHRLTRMGFNCGSPDGIFGPRTDQAVREFQRNVGLEPDGTAGFTTFWAFERLSRNVSEADSMGVRERLSLDALRSGVAGKVVVLDPGGADADEQFAIAEATILADVCSRLEGRLAALGTEVFYTRPPTPELVPERERADFANGTGAHLLLSLHVERVMLPGANGVATFYYGEPEGTRHSIGGRVAAQHIQSEITARTDLTDCRSHPRTWDLLRMTKMPIVWIELGYLSHPKDAARLNDPRFRDVLAESLAAAVVRFFSPRQD